MARFLCFDARGAPRKKTSFFSRRRPLAKGFSSTSFPALTTFVCRASEAPLARRFFEPRARPRKSGSVVADLGFEARLSDAQLVELHFARLRPKGPRAQMEDNAREPHEDELTARPASTFIAGGRRASPWRSGGGGVFKLFYWA